MQPRLLVKPFVVTPAATAGQALPEEAAVLETCALATGSGTAEATFTNQAIVTGAPAAGQVQFTGTATAPSTALTFNAALAATDQLVGTFVPAYGLVRAA